MRKAALPLITVATIAMTLATTSAQAEIAWQQNLRTAHAQAQAEGKLLLLHFYSDNCTWCDRLEAGSFQAPQVGQAVTKDFIPVKIHANKNPKLTEMFKVTRFPTDVIVNTKGTTLSHSVSPQQPDSYVAMLTSVLPMSLAGNVAPTTNSPIAGTPSAQVATAPNTAQPGYAQSPSPEVALQAGIQAPAADSPSGISLPSGLRGGATGQLAGVRSDGLTLEMPAFDTPSNEPAVPAADATAAEPVPTSNFADANVAGETDLAQQVELAMEGFCAVTVINDDRWAEGNPQFGVIHLGKLYLFVSEAAMQTFLADPVPYTPVLNEIDVVRFFEERKIVPGKREFGVKDPTYQRMFFFADEAARNHFEETFERYTDAAIEVMEKAVKDANPGT